MSVTVSPNAQADAIAAARWYDTQPSRYGDEFNDELLAAVRRIGETPRQFPLVEDGIPGREIREFFIERFEQRLIYVVTGDDALVVTITHASRKGDSWHRRVPTDT